MRNETHCSLRLSAANQPKEVFSKSKSVPFFSSAPCGCADLDGGSVKGSGPRAPFRYTLVLGWSNEMEFFYRSIVFLVSNKSAFHGNSSNYPHDILI